MLASRGEILACGGVASKPAVPLWCGRSSPFASSSARAVEASGIQQRGNDLSTAPAACGKAGSRRVGCAARASTSEPWWAKNSTPNMKDVNSIQELVDALADAGDRLVIVDFYAQWCSACRALYPKLCKMMEEEPEILFLKVDLEANRQMCKALNVKVLPYFHFYRGAEGRVDAFSCSVAKLQRMKDALANYTSPFCSLEPAPELPEFPEVHAHSQYTELPPPSNNAVEFVDSVATLVSTKPQPEAVAP